MEGDEGTKGKQRGEKQVRNKLRDFISYHLCCSRFKSCGMLRHVDW